MSGYQGQKPVVLSTCQIAQFKVSIWSKCSCQLNTADTSISPILLRRLLADASDNLLRSNKSPASYYITSHKIEKEYEKEDVVE